MKSLLFAAMLVVAVLVCVPDVFAGGSRNFGNCGNNRNFGNCNGARNGNFRAPGVDVTVGRGGRTTIRFR